MVVRWVGGVAQVAGITATAPPTLARPWACRAASFPVGVLAGGL